ncbi:MAG: DapH/DapD/GlmU-related protein, partial [Calditrichota bacterium]
FAKLEVLFKWLRLFYPQAGGMHILQLAICFFPQKILRINGKVPWPVHFTSTVLFPENITVGNRAELGFMPNCYINAENGIKVGHNVRMGPGVKIVSTKDETENSHQDLPIRIGNNVWIGMNTILLSGIEIGDNVIISSNSVVYKNISPNSIAAGDPCRVIRKKSPYLGKDYGEVTRHE